MPQIKMSEVREKFPMYGDVPDDQLLIAVRKKFYPEIPMGQFSQMIDRDTERERLQKEQLDEMGFGGQFLAGAGRPVALLQRTLKRLNPFGDYTAEQAAEEGKHDAALTGTAGGFLGNLAGEVALTAVPGARVARGVTSAARAAPVLTRTLSAAAPYLGAAAGGATVGAAMSPEDMGQGATVGAILGPVGEVVGRVGAAGYRGAKALVEPLTEAGRERVLKRTLERAATNLPAAQARAANPEMLMPGRMPTLGEATMDPGLIQLQRSAQSASSDVASALEESNLQRVASYREALDKMAGTGGQRQAAEAARRAAGRTMYDDAFGRTVDMAGATPEIQQRAAALLKRPSIQRAIPAAREAVAEMGEDFTGENSIRGLHQIKMALDDEIGEMALAGKNTKALEGTRDELLTLLDDLSEGSYDAARRSYAQASRPINQMQIAERLREKAFPAISEYSQLSTRTKPEQYARALENTMQTTRQATGMKNLAIEDVLDPAQLGQVQGIAKDMGRFNYVQEAARIPGSPTAQLMAGQNVLRGFLGPLGLPESALDHQIGKIMSGVAGMPYHWTEPQLQQMLARALTDPREAARILQAPDPRTVAEILQPYAAQAAVQLGVANQ